MKTVRILGMASNIIWTPPEPSVEVWCCNDPVRGYRATFPEARAVWTRWFNLHHIEHIKSLQARGYRWWTEQTEKRIVLQERQPDIKQSEAFPKEELLAYFGHKYFMFSAAWLIALALYEGFERIELIGFRLSPHYARYARQRPCFFYWVEEARRRGVEVTIPKDVGWDTPGDPYAYRGLLYGYETLCEFRKCRVCRRKRSASMGVPRI